MKNKRLRRKPRPAFHMDQLDQAVACCRNIETTALLLETCGHRKEDDELNSEMVANTGTMIHKEAVELHRLLAAFQQLPNHG